MEKYVKDLSVGDKLSSGVKVFERPFGSVKCPKNQINLGVEYSNGDRKIVRWGRYTTVNVIETSKSI